MRGGELRGGANFVSWDYRIHRAIYTRCVRVSTRGDYACRALLSLTLHGDEPGPTSVRDIAARTALPQPYLEQILLALKGAGLRNPNEEWVRVLWLARRKIFGSRKLSRRWMARSPSVISVNPIKMGPATTRGIACCWQFGTWRANTCARISPITRWPTLLTPLAAKHRGRIPLTDST